MRFSASNIATTHLSVRRRRDDGKDAAASSEEAAAAEDGNTAGHADDVAATADEDAGLWTVASAADSTSLSASASHSGGTGVGGGALPSPPSLAAAGIGLGAVGLIGAIAIGTGTRASATPSPRTSTETGTSVVPDKTGTSVVPGKTGTSVVPDKTGTSVVPDKTGTSVVPGKTGTPVVPDKTGTSVVPDKTGTPVVPDKTGTPVVPGKTGTPVVPDKTGTPVVPDKTGTSVVPDKTGTPVVPDKTGTSVVPTQSKFSISNAHVIEGEVGTRDLVFLVKRTGDTSQIGAVRFALQSDKSTVSSDELVGGQQGTVSFEPGESQQLIRLNLKTDHLREGDERVSVTLHQPTRGTLGRAEGDGTIHEVDVTRLQAAYGMRDLNSEHDGAAIRVRRSSDSKEMDIGFDAHGQLDRAALLTFVGDKTESKGYVTRWYDQSGNSRDMLATLPAVQGVIVDGGKIVTRADGSAAISFNAGRNGEKFDTMTADGLAASDWRSMVIHANVQSEGSDPGSIFSLGDGSNKRVLAHHPDNHNRTAFDVGHDSAPSRLSWTPEAREARTDVADNLVFEAHAENKGEGTAALNHTDAKQAIFRNGQKLVSDGDIPDQFNTLATWRLASHKEGQDWHQQVMFNEFLVYLAKDNSTPTPHHLIGSGQADVLSYSGEKDLKRIDGLAGENTLYVSGKATLDLTQFSEGVKHIEQFWLDNGEANTLKLTAATLSALHVKGLTIRLDAKDRVEIDNVLHPTMDLQDRLQKLSPAMQFQVLVGEAVI